MSGEDKYLIGWVSWRFYWSAYNEIYMDWYSPSIHDVYFNDNYVNKGKSNWPESNIPGCSIMLGYHGGVWFVQFGWDIKH